jgi:hypothetical protein
MLLDYLYIDRPRLTSYAEQIKATMTSPKRPQWKVALGLAGPTVELQGTTTTRAANDHELIQSVTRHLQKAGQLRTSRPASLGDAEVGSVAFVLESMKATKVIFQCDEDSAPRGLREVVVWVSNPVDRPSLRDANQVEDTEASGMFVYLLEGHWDESPTQHSYSMLTALNMLLDRLRAVGAKQGAGIAIKTSRDDWATPTEILVRHGGVKGDARMITALYRIRAVSENKIVNVGGRTVRTHDLFGYPLYIYADK